MHFLHSSHLSTIVAAIDLYPINKPVTSEYGNKTATFKKNIDTCVHMYTDIQTRNIHL